MVVINREGDEIKDGFSPEGNSHVKRVEVLVLSLGRMKTVFFHKTPRKVARVISRTKH